GDLVGFVALGECGEWGRPPQPRCFEAFCLRRREDELQRDLQQRPGVQPRQVVSRGMGGTTRQEVLELRGWQRPDAKLDTGILNPCTRADRRRVPERVVTTGSTDGRT